MGNVCSIPNSITTANLSSGVSQTIDPNGKILATPNLREFTFQELKSATKNFKVDNLLGEGSFGKVYKGLFEPSKSTQKVVAIKRLHSESLQGFEECQSEVNFLGRLSHPNLVKLLGYCWEGQELLLVYEFMQRGSLENHLFGRGSVNQALPWGVRIKIAIGVARGLAFVHASDDRLICRNIKASNILLDSSYNAKISDFGLAKLRSSSSHFKIKDIRLYGNAAFEYAVRGHLSAKSDVYSFGVLLVELLTGLRAVDTTRPIDKSTLVDWIKPYLSDERMLKNKMDTRLQGKYPSKAAIQTAELALKCLDQKHKYRPTMQEVLETLEKIKGMDA